MVGSAAENLWIKKDSSTTASRFWQLLLSPDRWMGAVKHEYLKNEKEVNMVSVGHKNTWCLCMRLLCGISVERGMSHPYLWSGRGLPVPLV